MKSCNVVCLCAEDFSNGLSTACLYWSCSSHFRIHFVDARRIEARARKS
jgi:hypothetical protein